MATIKERIDGVTENVTDGKQDIASAITEKGVETTSSATFSVMADNIRAIESGAKNMIYNSDETIYVIAGEKGVTMGDGSRANGTCSIAEGYGATANGSNSHAEGYDTTANGDNSHAEGYNTTTVGNNSHAEGKSYIMSPSDITSASTMGDILSQWHTDTFTLAFGESSHAEGNDGIAYGSSSHVEGDACQAIGNFSHAEGQESIASGSCSHAEGHLTAAGGNHSHSEGSNTTASGDNSHVEGEDSGAYGIGSHAEGYHCFANGAYSHAEGYNTVTSGDSSHAEGFRTQTYNEGEHASGRYNKSTSGGTSNSSATLFSVGFGSNYSTRKNAIEITMAGQLKNNVAWSTGSDRKLKENITSLENDTLEKVMQLNPVRFTLKDDIEKKERIGFIAQEVEALYPEYVTVSVDNEGEETRYLDYSQMVSILCKAIQELTKKVEMLENK